MINEDEGCVEQPEKRFLEEMTGFLPTIVVSLVVTSNMVVVL